MIIKRSGKRVDFNIENIINAIEGANRDEKIISRRVPHETVVSIAETIKNVHDTSNRDYSVEEIQDMVEDLLMETSYHSVTRLYIQYRSRHNDRRSILDQKISSIVNLKSEEALDENSNKNPILLPTQRDYMAGVWSSYATMKYLLAEDIVKAHNDGMIHFHDADYFAQKMHNCDLVNLDDMLQNGTVISGMLITKPHSFRTACNIAAQIIAQVASNQYGGQSIDVYHLVPFIEISRQKITKEVTSEFDLAGKEISIEELELIVENRLKKEISDGVQTLQYQMGTLMTTNGQTPFVSLFIYLNEAVTEDEKHDYAMFIEEIIKQRIKGLPDKTGYWITPAFPKILYVLEEDNIHEDSKYFYLTKLAAICTAKRMVPDYISEKKMKELKGDVYACMGCRSFLTPDRFTDAGIGNIANAQNYEPGKHKYWGRFNQGVVTINLPYIACAANGDENVFWKIFDDALELCHRALRTRHESLIGVTSDVAPILWQFGALARLKEHEPITPLLYNGYSTISLGYAGLYECVQRLRGVSHTSEDGRELALAIMHVMNDKCAEWKAAENIDYSLYGTPLESTTYKFAKALQNKFGIIKEVSDHNYVTNSYHICVREPIDAFDKLTKEAEFQALSPGGAISYVEVPNMEDNIEAVLAVLKHIYNTILYAELNTKSDHCDKCGYDGEIRVLKDDTNKLVWECPQCGCRDQTMLHVARRTCGYIGTQFWNQGRTQEIAERVTHL